MQALIIITLWVWAIVLLFGLILIIFLLGRRSVKDDSTKALIFINNNGHISRPKRGYLVETVREGSLFKYGHKQVIVPSQYKETYISGRRAIFISQAGQLTASPFDTDVSLTDSEKETLIYKLLEANIGGNAIKAIHGKPLQLNVVIVAIVALVIGIVITYGFIQFQTNQQARINTEQQSDIHIEEK